MIADTALRKQVRVVLSALNEGQSLSEEYLHAALGRFFPEPVSVEQMKIALNWNDARGWVELRQNKDEERTEWKLTKSGWIKEGF